MAFSHRLPIVASNAGPENDGALIGAIQPSLYLGVFSETRIAPNVYLQTFEHVSGTNFTIGSVAVAADGTIAGGVRPFGVTAAQVSSDDFFLIACDAAIANIYADIGVAGAFSVTPAVEIHDGQDFARLRTITTDGTNAFRNTGVRQIALAAASDPAAWGPGGTLLGMASRRWYRVRLAGVSLGNCTVAPRVDRLWLEHVDGTVSIVDLTAGVNGDLAIAPTAEPAFFPTTGLRVYYATANLAIGEDRTIWAAQANTRTRTIEFLTPSGWQSGIVTDPSNDFTTILTTTPQMFPVRWAPPATWASAAPPITLPAGISIPSAFWRSIHTTAITTMGPMTPASARSRARQYGNVNTTGIGVPVATTLQQVIIESIGTTTGTGATTLDLANLTTGARVSVTIPAGPTLPFNLDITDVSLAAAERYGLFHVSGTARLSDVVVHLL